MILFSGCKKQFRNPAAMRRFHSCAGLSDHGQRMREAFETWLEVTRQDPDVTRSGTGYADFETEGLWRAYVAGTTWKPEARLESKQDVTDGVEA